MAKWAENTDKRDRDGILKGLDGEALLEAIDHGIREAEARIERLRARRLLAADEDRR